MPDIILSTLNARYIHASLGLRYLYANMGKLQAVTEIREYIINTRPVDIAEQLLKDSPRIIGLGVYIWNVQQVTELVVQLKAISPETIVILGGPEISYETEQQDLYQYANYIICGQADLAFADVCQDIFDNEPSAEKIIRPAQPALDDIEMPYHYFNDEDIAHRIIYVEASRGCPFKCEFCLSSLDKTAWPFAMEKLLAELDELYQRGVRQFKFVDRTFNLKIKSSLAILNFFLGKITEKNSENIFLHFELIPDNLPEALKETIKRFPDGSLQFEIGIQSFDADTQFNISRKQNEIKTIENLRWLKQHTRAHLHTDLIVGLPGESLESFAQGFDTLVSLKPHEIQVGILKRLRGTPISRHTDSFSMVYNPVPPYNILSNNEIDFMSMQRMSRFARYWDMIANSGRFKNTLPLLLGDSPFASFLALSNWLFAETDQTHRISLNRLFQLVYQGMIDCLQRPAEQTYELLLMDFANSGLKGSPSFNMPDTQPSLSMVNKNNRRQIRHI